MAPIDLDDLPEPVPPVSRTRIIRLQDMTPEQKRKVDAQFKKRIEDNRRRWMDGDDE